MTYSTESHLRRLEQKVQLLTRINLTLVVLFRQAVLFCSVFAAFAWQSQDKSPVAKPLSQVGRYQVAGAGGNGPRGQQSKDLVLVDTRTGIVKPITSGTLGINQFKRFDEIKR